MLITLFLGVILAGCSPTPASTIPEAVAGASLPDIQEMDTQTTVPTTIVEAIRAEGEPTRAPEREAAPVNPPTDTPTSEPPPSPTPTATMIPTATPIPLCADRLPGDDLTAVVTLTFGISREYEPADLVPIGDDLPMHVTMGYPSEIREIALGPLVEMIEEMQGQDLQPRVMSAYRSYAAQAIAWDKWNEQYPEHAHIISAPPGYSEHQLGTVVDFGSPELAGIVGQEDIEFHTYFYRTSEGQWLKENAHRFGFTLSYPAEAFEITGFYYEPWHYRYVGADMANMLFEDELSLTEYQLADQHEPCIP